MRQVGEMSRGGMAMVIRKLSVFLVVLFVHAAVALAQPAANRLDAWRQFVATYGEQSAEWKNGALWLLNARRGAIKLNIAAANEEAIGAAAKTFLKQHTVLLGVPENQLRLLGVGIGPHKTTVLFEQECDGIPVEHTRLTLLIEDQSLLELHSQLIPDVEVQLPPSITASEAEAISRKNRPSNVQRRAAPRLVVSDADFTLPSARLAWRVGWETATTGVRFHYIDAHSGTLLATVSNVRTATGTVSGYGNLAQPGTPHLPYQGPSSLTFVGMEGVNIRVPGTITSYDVSLAFGQSSAYPVGDVNADHITDFAGDHATSSMTVWSGRTGAAIFTLQLNDNVNATAYKRWVCGIGDVNLDGYNDVLYLTAYDVSFPWTNLDSRLHVVSGLDGSQLGETPLPTTPHFYHYYLSGLGDVDNDGSPDFYLREQLLPSWIPLPQPNVWGVYSGKTLAVLYKPQTLVSPYIQPAYAIGDTNGDGIHDVAIAFENAPQKSLSAYAGAPGSLAWTWIDTNKKLFPSGGSFPDFNGDGAPELCISASAGGAQGATITASVYSGLDKQLLFSLPKYPRFFGDDVLSPSWSGVGVAGKFLLQLNDETSGLGQRVDWYYGATGEHAATDAGPQYPSLLTTIGDVDEDNQMDAIAVNEFNGTKVRIYGMKSVGESGDSGSFSVATGTAQFCNASLTGTGFRVRTLPGLSENLSADAKIIGGAAVLMFNGAPPLPDQEYRAAQVNAAYYASRAHAVAKEKAQLVGSPMAPLLDATVELLVNADPLSLDAPAHFAISPVGTPQIVMTASGAPVAGNVFFANGSSGSVIYHEYGHFVYRTLAGIGQDIPLDEALADGFAMYVSKQGVIGEDMLIDSGGQVAGNGWLRNYDVPLAAGGASDAKWPAPSSCGSNHCLGQPLAAFLWNMHKMLEAEEAQDGVERAECALVECISLNPANILRAVGRFIEAVDANGKLYDGDALYGEVVEVACQHGFGPNNVITTAAGGMPASLVANPTTIDPAIGGVAALSLNACPMYAGSQYAILGSLSVSEFGIPFKSKHLPIVYDPLMHITATNLNAAWYANTLGQLTPEGKATAQVTVPFVPALSGITLYFAAAIWGSGNVGPAVSVPAELKLL